MNTLTIKLKQHTPLIHFQHDQDGATLRASEVKPKLDKFIIKHAFHDNFDECKEYLVGYNPQKREDSIKTLRGKWNNGYRALNYKIRIEAKSFQDIAIPVKIIKKKEQTDGLGRKLYTTNNYPDNNASLIMSNIGGRAKEDVLNLSIANSIVAIFLVKDDLLLCKLKEFLYLFFAKTSFGNRTSKGFGSFEVKSINGKEVEGILDSDSYLLSFTMPLGESMDKEMVYKDVFKIIHFIWKSLKNQSGVKGKAEKNVLLKISPQKIDGADRIPSPIRFKPLVDFYKEKDLYKCDVNIATFFNYDVIKHVTGDVRTQYYTDKMKDLIDSMGSNLYNCINNITECSIDRQSVNIEK